MVVKIRIIVAGLVRARARARTSEYLRSIRLKLFFTEIVWSAEYRSCRATWKCHWEISVVCPQIEGAKDRRAPKLIERPWLKKCNGTRPHIKIKSLNTLVSRMFSGHINRNKLHTISPFANWRNILIQRSQGLFELSLALKLRHFSHTICMQHACAWTYTHTCTHANRFNLTFCIFDYEPRARTRALIIRLAPTSSTKRGKDAT